ncbi:hypothetical protein SARC_08357 [Sphaeroforma arctica JP610]|uniref:ATP-grasp domain-containing protein n=1 Tax=Sphaeroforma arctica JP610 TaxID=667725 RepID=A0A0L0FR11_9EUKA|nr:hypothetical protein SARC_08357 [Sphaeroforma arctica JP610]KNC79247.1 hypothetical protein SARC_08357 [Sphaeroforma arctica JP610]|eukprot:XP_014153149.1 hypothetical protein SARC_08357 [Sphaeroforma arctica JP610]
MPLSDSVKNLTGNDEATQQKRIEALAGLNVLFLAMPGLPGMSASLLEKNKMLVETGCNIYGVFTSKEEKLYSFLQEGESKLFPKELFADLGGDDIYVQAKNVRKAAEESGVTFDAVFSPYENMMTVVGAVAEEMNLPGNPVAAYTTARHKHNAREALRKAGIATPASALVKSPDDVPAAVAAVGFPMIVKPIAGAGSQGVYIARNEKEVELTVVKLIQEITGNAFLSYNPGLGGVDIVCEEYLEGDETDVDFLLTPGGNNEVVYTRICDDGPTVPPYFVENRENAPSNLPEDAQKQLKEYGEKVLRAFGFTIGCFHVECMWTKRGPRLIEVNPRMGGGPVPQFHQDVYGCDMYMNFFLALCNIPINPPVPEEPLCTLVSYWIATPTTGTLNSLSFLDAIKAHPNCISASANFQAGASLKGVDRSIPDVIGAFMLKFSAEEKQSGVEEAERLGLSLEFDITPAEAPRRASRRMSLLEPQDLEEVTH